MEYFLPHSHAAIIIAICILNPSLQRGNCKAPDFLALLRHFTAIIFAVESQTIDQKVDKKEMHFKTGLQHRRQTLFSGYEIVNPFYPCFYIDVLDRHFTARDYDEPS
jgi:hypothetical protein